MDNNYSLISERDRLKELFNGQVFETADVSRFMILYMQILEFAYEIKVIDEATKLQIANFILTYITEDAESEILPISNCLYVIALWIDSMSNWEAWENIAEVSSQKTAKIFVDKACFWFYNQIKQMLANMAEIKKVVNSMNVCSITASFESITQSILSLRTFNTANTSLDLKSMHSHVVYSDYFFLTDEIISKKKNYFEKLQMTVDAFINEMRILSKLDVKGVAKFRDEEQTDILKRREQRELQINREELKKLEKAYAKKIEVANRESRELDAKIEILSKEFSRKHPELSGQALEDAFDEYYDNLPEEFFSQKSDINAINQEYEKKRSKIIDKITEQEKQLEKEEQKEQFLRGELEFNISLGYLIREYALISLVKKGIFDYPSSPEERGLLLTKLTNSLAVTEFLNNDELDERDIMYLQKVL